MKKSWWKILCIALLFYTLIGGLILDVPRKKILNETIRNIYFHVPMWFGMMVLLTCSVVYSIKYLRKPDLLHDIYATAYARTGMLFGVLGLITGAVWANYTWGKPWSNDIKQLGAAMALLIYAAYFVLRNSMTDIDKRARVGAVYNIFAFAMLFPALWIVPRLMESLHPGGAGNPGADPRDMDGRMRLIFWLGAVPGFILLGLWISTIIIRFRKIEDKNLLHV
ncbi:MAG TPA: cytochrome c biogenesis protein CcsA [Agriterribacter sp.]|nr:cytochrome c biogenesis protein CcsA [Agriterribacter sp.]